MSKKKKISNDLNVSKVKKFKGVNKQVKRKINNPLEMSKMKNNQNIVCPTLSKSKNDNKKTKNVPKSKKNQNIKNNLKSISKNKRSKQNVHNIVSKSKTIQCIKDNDTIKSKIPQHKKNNSFQKLKTENNLSNKLNINKINAMLTAKEKTSNVEKKKKFETHIPLRERMLAQLKASRFRFLNEEMYNNNSSQSRKYFQDDPGAFYAYHEGYKQQVERWPMNPLDVIIESIKKMPEDYIVADFGCGEAKLADSVLQTVHSFDLVAINDKVKACDMAHTPLLTGRVNVVVFCLSLMGSNLQDYLLEANRVLNKNGILKIAEVESRFDKIEDFIKLMSHYGFVNTWKDLSQNLFYFMDFKKTKDVLRNHVNKLPVLSLKPCLYKKR